MTTPKGYGGTSLTGGGDYALDRPELDGDILNDLDLALVNTDGVLYPYQLDADSGLAESSPDVIAPDVNPGTKRWVLQGIHLDTLRIGSRASLVGDDPLLDPNRYVLRSTVADNAITFSVSANGNPVSGSSFEIFANDVIADRANTEGLRINANTANSIYEFSTLASGTGSHRSMLFSVGLFDTLFLDVLGDVGINITTPLGKLHVNQLSATGAKPVLLLSQLDIDEDMIEFTCTIGVGNAIEAIGAKTLTTTHFIKATITGVGEVYIPCGTIAV